MLQVHSDKPYKCDRCQAAFRYKGNLASHKTVHTGKEKKINKNVLISKELRQLFWEIFMFVLFFFFKERSRTDVIFVVLSLTDQPTSKLTLASTQERSHTSVRRVELVLYRY